ncbi:MAG: glycoside hydrolase family 127 protein, partial [Methylobacteriaceae bacterium]|nr:glycoside hydrolase family 127 protein [Methylobacteriaceae bacterium]
QPFGTASKNRGYVDISRQWNRGDMVELDLPMPVERLYAHPNVRADAGRVCLKRGPLVYCVEEIDNPNAPVGRLRLPRAAQPSAMEDKDLFGGVVRVVAHAELASADDWDDALYRPAPSAAEPARMTAVPYYVWNNRGPNRMSVWLPES